MTGHSGRKSSPPGAAAHRITWNEDCTAYQITLLDTAADIKWKIVAIAQSVEAAIEIAKEYARGDNLVYSVEYVNSVIIPVIKNKHGREYLDDRLVFRPVQEHSE